MRLCSHVIKVDTGLAPNPFHGYCTSALCTPSHTRLKLKQGEWLIVHSPIRDRNRLVYAMRISDMLSMNEYFYDDRFAQKKPKPDGSLEEQCGDNIYYKNNLDEWKRLPSPFHNCCSNFKKDVGNDFKGRPVFVADHFYYFGCRRVAIPPKLEGVIRHSQGTRYTEDPLATEFVSWLEANYEPGVRGIPANMADCAG
jgi:hypothetical protein